MSKMLNVVTDHMVNNNLTREDVAKKCGWPESKLASILNGYQKLNAADYGALCEALEVPYDCFIKQSKGVHR
jgi:transcriptional regulator with XRE-family HTH domain